MITTFITVLIICVLSVLYNIGNSSINDSPYYFIGTVFSLALSIVFSFLNLGLFLSGGYKQVDCMIIYSIFSILPSFNIIGVFIRYIIAFQYRKGDFLYGIGDIKYIDKYRRYIIAGNFDKIYFPFYMAARNKTRIDRIAAIKENRKKSRLEKNAKFIEIQEIKEKLG